MPIITMINRPHVIKFKTPHDSDLLTIDEHRMKDINEYNWTEKMQIIS